MIALSGPAWRERGVRILAVSVDDDERTVQQFVAAKPLPYPVAFDAGQELATRYAVEGLPTTYVIGRDGRIAERLAGATDLMTIVEEVLHASAAPRE